MEHKELRTRALGLSDGFNLSCELASFDEVRLAFQGLLRKVSSRLGKADQEGLTSPATARRSQGLALRADGPAFLRLRWPFEPPGWYHPPICKG